jgi:hypothetical protein
VQRRGWYIKGLEPTAAAANASNKEWVPSFLQSRLERDIGARGIGLGELAALAASLEDIVADETTSRLKEAAALLGLNISERIPKDAAVRTVTIFYTDFLGAIDIRQMSDLTPHEVWQQSADERESYAGWADAEQWLYDMIEPTISGKEAFSLEEVVRAAVRIEENYHQLNDVECRDLKRTMQDIEGSRAGRVRLPAFYKMGLFSHWQFNEKADYLRAIGSLVESEPGDLAPSVVVPNYLSARTNCLEASSLYALCCRNECEDLMGHLERSVGGPLASEQQVIDLVSNLSSDTVMAPRELSPVLLHRLSEVAAGNGGAVPLHGRLFAQWMHHAYPRECPFPHKAGDTSPQTPDEWMHETGQVSFNLTEEEIRAHIESDVCAALPGDSFAAPRSGCGTFGEAEEGELPWNDHEELLDEPLEPPMVMLWLVLAAPFLSGGLVASTKMKAPVSMAPEVGMSVDFGV